MTDAAPGLADPGHSQDEPTFTHLRWVSIVGPAVFVSGIIVFTLAMVERMPLPLVISAAVLASTAAAALFSSVTFQVIERSEQRLRQRNTQLAAVQAAAMSLNSEAKLRPLLQRFVALSAEITDATYGALAIRRADGSIEEFIVTGMDAATQRHIGAPPVGRGLLGVIMDENTTVRIPDIATDARSGGFPANHPPMRSLLGVPVTTRGEVIGNLYLTDKRSADEFSEHDEELVRLFAAHAAVAVETRRLHEQLQQLAVMQERERIGMDLHDGIIQSIYAVGLKLEATSEDVATRPEEARRALDGAIEDLTVIIGDVRRYIFALRRDGGTTDMNTALAKLAEEFRINSLIDTTITLPPLAPSLTEAQRDAAYHIAQEALANVRRHSGATRVDITMEASDAEVRLRIADNGRGFNTSGAVSEDHRGMRNMAARARTAEGALEVISTHEGTEIRASIPLNGAVTPGEDA